MQIESRPGVENVEKIAAVDGVDLIFIGPFDLSKKMNLTRGGEEHEAVIQRILKASHAAGKKADIFCTLRFKQIFETSTTFQFKILIVLMLILYLPIQTLASSGQVC